MNILIVDDDDTFAWVIFEAIDIEKHTVKIAGTGKEAIELVREERFDLVLLDILLPDCRGNELIPDFKKLSPQIGIVTMTGHNSRELELEIRQQGIYYYLIKPFSVKTIKDIVDHVSDKKDQENTDGDGLIMGGRDFWENINSKTFNDLNHNNNLPVPDTQTGHQGVDDESEEPHC